MYHRYNTVIASSLILTTEQSGHFAAQTNSQMQLRDGPFKLTNCLGGCRALT